MHRMHDERKWTNPETGSYWFKMKIGNPFEIADVADSGLTFTIPAYLWIRWVDRFVVIVHRVIRSWEDLSSTSWRLWESIIKLSPPEVDALPISIPFYPGPISFPFLNAHHLHLSSPGRRIHGRSDEKECSMKYLFLTSSWASISVKCLLFHFNFFLGFSAAISL